MKLILTVAAGLLVAYLLLVLVYALMQRSLIYYPTTITLAQAEQQAAAQGVTPWLNAEGQWQGWRFRSVPDTSEAPRRRAVVFHGNAGMALNRDYYAQLLSRFRNSGPWEVFVFEYPGYGPRPGRPGEGEFTAAALATVDELIAQHPDPLLIIGESIGSGVASNLARERSAAVAAVMLITPFDSLVHLARHHMPLLPAGLLLRDRYDNLAALSDYRGPLVVITAEDDTIVPSTFAEPLLAQHRGPALHGIQESAGHNSLHFRPDRDPWPTIDRFLDGHSR
jgi:pimeloyl-ACP methyl ester carboxylesterase